MNSFGSFSSRLQVKLCIALLFVLGSWMAEPASATLAQYRMTASTGGLTDMSSANIIWYGYPGARDSYGYYPTYSGFYDFGFNFNFDGSILTYLILSLLHV